MREFAKVKQKFVKIQIFFIIITALIFSMYQETNAQKKPKTPKTVKAIQVQTVPPTISYTVSMSKPWTHLLEVEMRLSWPYLPEKAELKMPVWTPGSYLVREYARHVEDFSATDAAGNKLAWEKTSKNTWQVDTKGAKEIVAKYNVYANELTVRTNELNSDHAFFTPAALLMFPKGQINTASTVKVNPFGNWKVGTGLPPVAGQTNVFRAENYDVLYDSPFEISDYKEISFTVQGKPHRYIITGEGNYDLPRLAADTAKIVEEAYKIFGELPYNDYTFIVNLRGGGGLEHLNSTALQWQKFGFKPDARYYGFLGLVAHEYFHNFNVKRIRPDALGPFDYENENYTKLLWVAEGATSYYESVLNRRAGFETPGSVLAGKAGAIQQLQSRPGRLETSVEEASFDAWIKYYRQDENSVNNQISYYDKGDILNFLLDVKIRTDSNGAKSLDDVMRYLYNEYFKKGKNYTPADYQKVSEMMAGKSLEDFFSKYVRGREDIDYNSILIGFGLRLNVTSGRETAYLGADLRQDGDRLNITALAQGTPAYEQGLNANDQIIAVDGNRASQNFLSSYLAEKKPGDKIKLTVFRFDTIREMEITLGGRSTPSYRIVAVENPTEDQKRLYRDYFGADLQ